MTTLTHRSAVTISSNRFMRQHSDRARVLALTVESMMKARPDGFTIATTHNTGVILLGVAGDYLRPSGYAVGGIIPGLRVSTRNPRAYTALDKYATWAEKYFILKDALSDPIYVGGWRDDANFWLDATLIIQDREVALKFARLKGEKAVGVFINGEYAATETV